MRSDHSQKNEYRNFSDEQKAICKAIEFLNGLNIDQALIFFHQALQLASKNNQHANPLVHFIIGAIHVHQGKFLSGNQHIMKGMCLDTQGEAFRNDFFRSLKSAWQIAIIPFFQNALEKLLLHEQSNVKLKLSLQENLQRSYDLYTRAIWFFLATPQINHKKDPAYIQGEHKKRLAIGKKLAALLQANAEPELLITNNHDQQKIIAEKIEQKIPETQLRKEKTDIAEKAAEAERLRKIAETVPQPQKAANQGSAAATSEENPVRTQSTHTSMSLSTDSNMPTTFTAENMSQKQPEASTAMLIKAFNRQHQLEQQRLQLQWQKQQLALLEGKITESRQYLSAQQEQLQLEQEKLTRLTKKRKDEEQASRRIPQPGTQPSPLPAFSIAVNAITQTLLANQIPPTWPLFPYPQPLVITQQPLIPTQSNVMLFPLHPQPLVRAQQLTQTPSPIIYYYSKP